MTKEEIKTEYDIFGDVWKLFKKYYHPQMSDEYWEDLYAESVALGEKYDSRLCEGLVLAVWSELVRKYYDQDGSE